MLKSFNDLTNLSIYLIMIFLNLIFLKLIIRLSSNKKGSLLLCFFESAPILNFKSLSTQPSTAYSTRYIFFF